MSGTISGGQGGAFSRFSATLASPFGNSITWMQLASVTVFVLVVALAWRQVTQFFTERV